MMPSNLMRALRALEVAHNTHYYPRAVSTALLEVVDAIQHPPMAFTKFGKKQNPKTIWANTHRMRKALDAILQ